jgi:hypothetical protein
MTDLELGLRNGLHRTAQAMVQMLFLLKEISQSCFNELHIFSCENHFLQKDQSSRLSRTEVKQRSNAIESGSHNSSSEIQRGQI